MFTFFDLCVLPNIGKYLKNFPPKGIHCSPGGDRLSSPDCRKYVLTGLSKILPEGPCRTYPTPSEFTHHLQNLPNTFRIYPTSSEFTQHLQNLPTPSEFIQHLQNLPTPSEFTQHLQNFPNTFRIYPTPSECTHPSRIYPPLQNLPTTFRIYPPPSEKNLCWGRWTFLDLF